MISISASNMNNVDIIKEGYEYVLKYPCSNDDCFPYTVSFNKGKYRFELWGASGIDNLTYENNRGSYVSGIISLLESRDLYFYIGNVGRLQQNYSYNGGGSGSSTGNSGGGATDVRLSKTDDEKDFKGLLSRIMVAGGASGASYYNIKDSFFYHKSCGKGNGGKLSGDPGYININSAYTTEYNISCAYGGTQTSPGVGSVCYSEECMYGCEEPTYGKFGVGADSLHETWGSGGGGGYFGGGSGGVNHKIIASGAGGSSFVSGCSGCVAIAKNSTSDETITFLNSSIHYSELFFYNIDMKSGANNKSGPGYAKITYIGEVQPCIIIQTFSLSTFLSYLFVLLDK